MKDAFGRNINYLRISVTDRCNLRCEYCMDENGVAPLSHDSILRFEEIADFARVAVRMGIDKVRITGGEPLVRKGIVKLIAMLSKIEGIRDFSMTTNGILLSEFSKPLKDARLMRVNVSLDTMNSARFCEITRGGNLQLVLNGIFAANEAGLLPIKLNCVVEKSSSEPDAQSVAQFARTHGFAVRFIRRMDLNGGDFGIVEGGTGGDCARCNRLRLSSDGFLRPCLFNDIAFDIRKLGSEEAIRQALAAKPKAGERSNKNRFYTIGG